MRTPLLALALTGAMLCAGCSELVGLRAFVTDKDAVQDARLLGLWVDDDDQYTVRQDGNGYLIDYKNQKTAEVYKLKAKMWKAGEATILDLEPAEDDAFRIPVHSPLRVWIERDKVRIAFLHSKWLKDLATAQLAVQTVGERLLITSPGDAVTRFLRTYGGDARAYTDTGDLTRPK